MTASTSHVFDTTTSSSVNATTRAVMAVSPRLSAYDFPWRNSRRYRRPTGNDCARLATTRSVSSVELLSTTSTSQPPGIVSIAARLSRVVRSSLLRLNVQIRTVAHRGGGGSDGVTASDEQGAYPFTAGLRMAGVPADVVAELLVGETRLAPGGEGSGDGILLLLRRNDPYNLQYPSGGSHDAARYAQGSPTWRLVWGT